MKRLFTIMVVLMLMGTAALAMPVSYNEGTMELSCSNGEENVTLNVEQFHLLGMGADGQYLIYAYDGYYSLLAPLQGLKQEDAARIDGMTGISEDSFSPLARGAKGDAVMQFQNALVTLGYLDGGADGDFGGKTETAIMAFQEAMGLEQTGIADARLQMLALSMLQPGVVLENPGKDEERLATIAEKTGLDPQMILDNGLIFDYDDIAGTGFLSDGSVITYTNQAVADIDQYALTLQFGLLVQDKEGGRSIEPVARVGCLCVRRPVIEEIVLKSGDYRGTATIENASAELNGVKTEESGTVILEAKAVEALANAEKEGELKIRVTGKYNSFDITVDKAQLASVSSIGAVMREIM